ncbi:MAG TPA: LysR family transcriptional regulator [Azospirillum sp.]|nr:LysR family transcriptional regulator [Azospirillum sp.]
MMEPDLSRADLNLLVLFEVVLQERHVGRAAERLNLSPSAVSHGLGRLRRLLNDPVFLRTPKGVVPTARALELAGPVADILARVRQVVASAEPFDPATTNRRFIIGAPDGVSAVLLPTLLEMLATLAPGVDVGVRQLLPLPGIVGAARAWQGALDDLESRAIDVAVVPVEEVPARFVARTLYEENFVIATRAGHPFAADPTLDRYCEMRHVVVSMTGDAEGLFDEALARLGRSRRIALTVPNFMQSMGLVAATDLIAALPRKLVEMHAARYGLRISALPVPSCPNRIQAIATKASLADPGVKWLFGILRAPG